MGPNSHDLQAKFVRFMAKFVPVRVCMILSRSKFVGLNFRRSEFTFHDSAPLINLHSMLFRTTPEFGILNLRSLLNLDLIRPLQLNKLDNK